MDSENVWFMKNSKICKNNLKLKESLTIKKFLEISRNFLEISRNFLEMSRNFLENSRKFLEISRKFLENSRKFLEFSRTAKMRSVLRKQHRSMSLCHPDGGGWCSELKQANTHKQQQH